MCLSAYSSYIHIVFHFIIVNFGIPDSVAGMTTRCGLNGPGLEPHCGQEFSLFYSPSTPALGPIQPSVQRVLNTSPGTTVRSW